MDWSEVVRILKSLAAGFDPFTGAKIPAHSACRHLKTAMALQRAARELEKLYMTPYSDVVEPASVVASTSDKVKKNMPKKTAPQNGGKSWDAQEEQDLLKAFDGGTSIDELAEMHQRTPGAIRSRLLRCGRLVSLLDDVLLQGKPGI